MGGITSLSIAASGMWAAQGGISVVGHNISNANTIGYSRQSIIQTDSLYLRLSSGQVGYGTSVSTVRQIRNSFLDIKYRDEVTKATYYSAKVETGQQIESLLGELQSEYTTQSVINDLWDSLNELVTDPASLETRGNFVSTAITLVDKIKVVYDGLVDYQNNLNTAVKTAVKDINFYVSEINRLSNLIKANEANGANANDYKDARNSCMDALSEIANVTYRNKNNGEIDISLEGRALLANGLQYNIGLRYTTADSGFVEPVFTNSTKILKCDDYAVPVFNLTENNDDGGYIKGLLVSRGIAPVNYTTLKSLVPSSDFFLDGAPNPANYTLGAKDPAYQAAANTYQNTLSTNLANLVTAMPVVPDQSAYPLGATDPQYIEDMVNYNANMVAWQTQYNDAENFFNKYSEYREDEGLYNFNYERMLYNSTECTIPVLMQNLDQLFHDIVTLINDTVAPTDHNSATAPSGLDESKTQFLEIFKRTGTTYEDRYSADGTYLIENSSKYSSLYTIGNVVINPELLDPSGYNQIAFSSSGDQSDSTLIKNMLDKWDSGICTLPSNDGRYEALSIDDAYNLLVTVNATSTQSDQSFFEAQVILVNSVESSRLAIMGVSLDEELANMTVYQNAYEASARIFAVIDSMLDTLVNGTGRVGL